MEARAPERAERRGRQDADREPPRRGDERRADQLKREAAQLGPRIEAERAAAEQKYQQLLAEGHSEEEVQQKMLDAELWQQSEDVKGLRDDYHGKAIGHMIVLNGLADQLIDTKKLAKNSEELLKERSSRFEDGFQKIMSFKSTS